MMMMTTTTTGQRIESEAQESRAERSVDLKTPSFHVRLVHRSGTPCQHLALPRLALGVKRSVDSLRYVLTDAWSVTRGAMKERWLEGEGILRLRQLIS